MHKVDSIQIESLALRRLLEAPGEGGHGDL